MSNPLYENRHVDFYFRNQNKRTQLGCRGHLHYHIELVCLLEGDTVACIDSRQYPMKGGDVFVAFPNQVHRYISIAPEKYLLFIISPDMMPELIDQFTTTLPTSPLVEGALLKNPRLLEIAMSLEEICQKTDDTRYIDQIRKGYLLAFFGELFQMMSLEEPRGNDATILRAIMNYCTRNFTAELSLSVLEKELHVSKYYISHLFSERLHIRFNDYINSLRISCACRYLQRNDRSVTEISQLVGFNTLRTFNRAFSKQTGLTPSEYKKSLDRDRLSASIPI